MQGGNERCDRTLSYRIEDRQNIDEVTLVVEALCSEQKYASGVRVRARVITQETHAPSQR